MESEADTACLLDMRLIMYTGVYQRTSHHHRDQQYFTDLRVISVLGNFSSKFEVLTAMT
jgi:hypothetical protein